MSTARPGLTATTALLCAFAISACATAAPSPGEPDPADAPAPRQDTAAVTDRPTATIPPAVHPVFAIEGAAHGTFRPGEPVDIVARVRADAVVDTAVLLITLPELADARRTGRDATYQQPGTGGPYPSLDSIAGRMEPGAPLLLRRRVTFHAPGYYRVSMVVRARTRPITHRRLPTVDEAYHSFLIRIDEERGFVASDPEVDTPLERAVPVVDPAAALPLPEPSRAAASAPAYSAVLRTLNVDVTGDGVTDRLELSADAELNARGEPLFEHGHRWRVIVRSRDGAFALYDEFVPSGDVRIRTETRPIDERGAPPVIVIAWRSRESWGERRVRYDAAASAFVVESVVRVVPE